MNIRAFQAFLITHDEPKIHRWALASELVTAVCLKDRKDFPDVASVVKDMDNALWLCQRHDAPDHFSLMRAGRLQGIINSHAPPADLAMFARVLDALSEENLPEGCTILPIWALAGTPEASDEEH